MTVAGGLVTGAVFLFAGASTSRYDMQVAWRVLRHSLQSSYGADDCLNRSRKLHRSEMLLGMVIEDGRCEVKIGA